MIPQAAQATQGRRSAKLELARGDDGTVLNVLVPQDITAQEFGNLHRVIVNDVVKRLTGCACLSGQVRVVLQDEFQDVLRVDLATGTVI